MRLVQVCNVGQICGGTAACAWTITKAFPDWNHTVLFLSQPGPETRQAFSHCDVRHITKVSDDVLSPLQADLVILHNTAAKHVGQIRCSEVIQYQHSVGNHAHAEVTVACSKWLAEKSSIPISVLYQPVPRPAQIMDVDTRSLSDEFIIGRFCTPSLRKWPLSALPVYKRVTEEFSRVRWEFVGCPISLQPAWRDACDHRVTFLSPGWNARSNLWRWHGLLYHHPTLTESFGRTVAEALRCGCVPIVDDRGGFREQFLPRESGALCNNEEEFVAAVDQLLSPGVWWKESHQARLIGDERFSLASFRRRFLRLLSDRTLFAA